TEGAAFSGVVASFTDADPSGTASDYTATITWGDGHVSAGTIAANGQRGFNDSGTNTFAEEGIFSANVQITDLGGTSASTSFAVTVSDAALTATAKTLTSTEGVLLNGIIASFTDADPAGDPSDYTATITWASGQSSPGQILRNTSGGFDVWGSTTYAEDGSYP